MADSKITALAALTAADPVNDMFPVVDVSDTSMAASGTTKRISVNNILSSSPTASGALTVTGLVTAGSATITGAATVGTTLGVTGDLTVGTNALIVFPATNRVLINQTSAIQGDSLEVSAKSNAGAISLFGRASDNSSVISFRANGAATQKASVQGSDSGLDLVTGTTVKQSIDSSTGNVTVSLGNLVMGTSGKGIDFSATANSSGTMTSELLNDYEEGTFTPIVQGSTTAGVGVYSVQIGRYTKTGRLVTVEIYITWTAHTGTGNLRIGGLPFTVNAAAYSAATIGLISSITLSASNTASAFNEINTTYINIVQSPVGGGTFTDVPMDVSGTLVISSTYSV